jgi:[acyl-carrier-protein] S-malonyltransferase
MKPASLIMEEELLSINFRKPETKFVSNVTADFEDDKDKINRLLVEQIYSKVRWRESILKASSMKAKKIVEVGSGKVLSGINKRIGVDLEIQNISTMEDIDLFLSINKGDL